MIWAVFIERPFSEIWTDPDEPLLKGLRDRRSYDQGPMQAVPVLRRLRREPSGSGRLPCGRPLGPRSGLLSDRRGNRARPRARSSHPAGKG